MNTSSHDMIHGANVFHSHSDLLILDHIRFRSKLVASFRSFGFYCCEDPERNTFTNLNTAPFREIVQKALFSGYQRETDFESDVLKVVQSSFSIPLIELKIGLDLTITQGTPHLPIDPFEEINMDNWKEKGALREYYAAASRDELELMRPPSPLAASSPESLTGSLSTAVAELTESVSRKTKHSSRVLATLRTSMARNKVKNDESLEPVSITTIELQIGC